MLLLPFQLLRVLDFTTSAAGAWATRYFGDFGAEVIKVELPGAVSDVPADLQCNKLSCVIDYTEPDGRDLTRRLVARAEIIFLDAEDESATKAGIDYETLAELTSQLVVVSIRNGGLIEAGPAAAGAAVAALFHFRAIGDGQEVQVDGEQVLLNLRGDKLLAQAAGLSIPAEPRQPEARSQGNAILEPVAMPDGGEQMMSGVPFKLSRTPGHVRLPPPRSGEHNDYVLRELLRVTPEARSTGSS
jgi:crotonobetainyl-CoA:carnitine CoA-transferase CaiB-like acyl-CoA transferase